MILRQNRQSNCSDRGAATQAILVSVYRTPKLLGLNPAKTIPNGIRTYLAASQLSSPSDTDIVDG